MQTSMIQGVLVYNHKGIAIFHKVVTRIPLVNTSKVLLTGPFISSDTTTIMRKVLLLMN